jgi:hypothetical protein
LLKALGVRINKMLRWGGLLFAAPFILLFGLYIFGLIVQLWPEPITDTFRMACNYDLTGKYSVSDRDHSYSNWMHGVWYADRGTVKLSLKQAEDVLSGLMDSGAYVQKGDDYEKFEAGKILANCTVDLGSGDVKYNLVLW